MPPISLLSWVEASRMSWVRLRIDFQRLFGLADFQKFADEIFVFLQGVQQAGELRPGVVEFFGGALGLVLQFAPLLGQKLPFLGLEAGFLRQGFQLVVDVVQRLDAELRDRAVVRHRAQELADRLAQLVDLGSRLGDVGRRRRWSRRLSWIVLLSSGTLFWKASSCCENSSTGATAPSRPDPRRAAAAPTTRAAAPAWQAPNQRMNPMVGPGTPHRHRGDGNGR